MNNKAAPILRPPWETCNPSIARFHPTFRLHKSRGSIKMAKVCVMEIHGTNAMRRISWALLLLAGMFALPGC